MQKAQKRKLAVGSMIEAALLIATAVWKILGHLSTAETGYELLKFVGNWLMPFISAAGLLFLGWIAFEPRLKTKATIVASSPTPIDDWKVLAAKFSTIPRYSIDAEWYSETLDSEGNSVGERWRITNAMFNTGAVRDFEALCALAGAMLLKSPKVSAALSQKVKSRTNNAWRWLYFLKERPGLVGLPVTTGYVQVGTQKQAKQSLTFEDIAREAERACIECAAKEL